MLMIIFTICAGVASIISFLNQIYGWFELRKIKPHTITAFFLGIFLGCLLGWLMTDKIEIVLSLSNLEVFICVLLILTLMLFYFSANAEKQHKQDIYSGLGVFFCFIFMCVLVFGPISRIENSTDFNFGDYITLGESHSKKGNIDEAILHYERARRLISSSDPRAKRVNSIILKLKENQISNSTNINKTE